MQNNLFEFQQRPVNGRRVKQARELRALTQGALADAIGVDQTMIAHIERATKQPSADVLEGLTTELNFPKNFFYQESSPEFPRGSLLFRAKSGVGKRIVAQAHAHAEIAFEMVLRLSVAVSLVPVRLASSADPMEGARQTRAVMCTPPGPLPEFIRAIERLGVLIIPLPDLPGCEAFAVWAGPAREYPVIGLVVERAHDRIRMSAAHELGHLVLHRSLSGGTQDMETQAYRFAAELLMPAKDIAEDLRSEKLNIFRLAALKQKWNVSMQALARRARDLQVISDRQYSYLMRQMSMKGWRTEEPTWAPQQVEKPRALRKLLEVAFGSPIKINRVAKDLNVSESFVKTILDMCAAAPGEHAVQRKNSNRGGVVPFGRRKGHG
jgi:Zn-dependent peptidase ImmA (M78 family)/transcriptional regulator with XRE-family HTH domain